jgi:hypothetical protein
MRRKKKGKTEGTRKIPVTVAGFKDGERGPQAKGYGSL